jgi:hypothetical protein
MTKPDQTVRLTLTDDQLKKLQKDLPVRLSAAQVLSSDGRHAVRVTDAQFKKYKASQTAKKGMVLKRDSSVHKGGFLATLGAMLASMAAEEGVKAISKLVGGGTVLPTGAGVILPDGEGSGICLPGTSCGSASSRRKPSAKKKKKK